LGVGCQTQNSADVAHAVGLAVGVGAQDATIDLVMLAAAARPLVGVGDLAEQIERVA